MSDFDPYKILGVDKAANGSEIKQAYRKRARETHPDVNNGEDAEFLEVQRSFELLSDEMMRAHFDVTGAPELNPELIKGAAIIILNTNLNDLLEGAVSIERDLEEIDLGRALRNLLNDQKRRISGNVQSLTFEVKQIRKLILRVKRKDGEDNFLVKGLLKRLTGKQAELQTEHTTSLALDQAMVDIDTFTFETPAEEGSGAIALPGEEK